jgi:1-acyl-sn-glycerol-3-phosphate acyltransferase
MVRWFYYVARAIVILILLLFTRWQVKGKENVPKQGPLLIVANHLNLTDPPLVSVSLNRTVIFMAKEELFRSRFSGYFISSFGAFPVHRGQLDMKALRQAEKVLDKGLALAMFPEATRSKNAQLQPAFPGSALIAVRSGAPILPIAITGTERIKGATWILHHPHITVNIGHPFHLPSVNGKASKTELANLTNIIMEHIAELLPVEYRGHYVKQRETSDTEG